MNIFQKYKKARRKSIEIHEIRRAWYLLGYSTDKMLNEKKPQKVEYFISAVNEMKNSLKNKNELCHLPDEYRTTIQELDIKNLYDVEKLSNLLFRAFIEVRANEKPPIILTPISVYGNRGLPFVEAFFGVLIMISLLFWVIG